MPAYRTQKRSRCAFASPEPAKKPRVPRKVLSPEEKAANALVRDKKKAWEATLVPAVDSESFFWPKDTVGMFPNDAKKAFKLTPKELATLKREHVQCSSKSFVSLAQVEDLARRKHIAFGGSAEDYTPPSRYALPTHTRSTNDSRRTQTNWGIYRERRSRW